MAIYIKHTNSMTPTEIRVDVGTPDDAIRIVQKLLDDKLIKITDFYVAFLNYSVKHLPNPDPFKVDHYPLRFIGKCVELYVSGIAAGYKGVGPAGTLKVLEMLGFIYTSSQEQTITETTFDLDDNRVDEINMSFSK